MEASFTVSLWLSASHDTAVSEDAFLFHQLFWCECVPAQDHVPLTAHDTAFLSPSLSLTPVITPNNFSHWFYYDSTTPTHPSPLTAPKGPTARPKATLLHTRTVNTQQSDSHACLSFPLPDPVWWWRVADGDPRQTKLWTLVSVLCLLVTVP